MDARDPTDLLHGLPAIAGHLGISVRQAKYRATTGDVPTFKMGRTVCALKSAIAAALAEAAKGGRA